LPKRTGKGSFLSAIIGVRFEDKRWWGEGEVKFYMNDDEDFSTIAGTGSEDYVCLSFGLQETLYLYHEANLNRSAQMSNSAKSGFVFTYRWHVQDPIFWKENICMTIQQIGYRMDLNLLPVSPQQLYERQDDWSTATF